MLVGVQLPDGASLERTDAAIGPGLRHRPGDPGRPQGGGAERHVGARQQCLAGQRRRCLRHPRRLGRARQEAGPGPALDRPAHRPRHRGPAGRPGLPPRAAPPIQGIGNAGGFQIQVEQKDGSFDYVKLQNATANLLQQASTQSGLTNLVTSRFRAGAPHVRVDIDHAKAETLKVSIGEVFTTLSSYLGSAYVNRFNKFGLSLMVSPAGRRDLPNQARRHPEAAGAQRRRQHGADRRPGRAASVGGTAADQPLQSLSVGRDRRFAGDRFQLRRSHRPDGPDRQPDPAAGHRLRMDGDVLPGEPGRQPADVRVRAGHPVGLSLPGRPVRKLDRAARRDLRGAAVARRTGHRAGQPRPRQQHLHPDRPDAA